MLSDPSSKQLHITAQTGEEAERKEEHRYAQPDVKFE